MVELTVCIHVIARPCIGRLTLSNRDGQVVSENFVYAVFAPPFFRRISPLLVVSVGHLDAPRVIPPPAATLAANANISHLLRALSTRRVLELTFSRHLSSAVFIYGGQ